MIKKSVTGFLQFIRQQGVVGLAIGFIIGGAISKLVASFVADVVQPSVGMIFGSTAGLIELHYGPIMYGKFLAVLIDFFIVAAVVYYGFKGLKLDKLDMPKDGGSVAKPVPKF